MHQRMGSKKNLRGRWLRGWCPTFQVGGAVVGTKWSKCSKNNARTQWTNTSFGARSFCLCHIQWPTFSITNSWVKAIMASVRWWPLLTEYLNQLGVSTSGSQQRSCPQDPLSTRPRDITMRAETSVMYNACAIRGFLHSEHPAGSCVDDGELGVYSTIMISNYLDKLL